MTTRTRARIWRSHLGSMLVALLAAVVIAGLSTGFELFPAARAAGNMLVNPGFEEANGPLPTGWTVNEKGKGKGTVRVVEGTAVEGRRVLWLEPNASNITRRGEVDPLGVGQGFKADAYRGQTLHVAGILAASGGARAVLGLYAHRSDGKVLSARIEHEDREPVRLQDSLTLPNDGKTLFIVLLAFVEGRTGTAGFDDLYLGTEAPQRAAAPAPPTRAARGAPAAATARGASATINVDASAVGRVIPRTLYGANLEWIWNANGLWDPERGAIDPRGLSLTRDLGVSQLRFPGGIFADFYHWRDGIGARSKRASRAHFPEGPSSRHVFGSDELADLAERIGASVMITANIATGTPEEAADWARYLLAKPGRPALDWELGNENYVRSDLPRYREAGMPPDEYVRRVRRFAAALRAVSPDLRIGAIAEENFSSVASPTYPTWTRDVLRGVGADIDFISVHNAYAPTLATGGGDLRSVYRAMLAAPVLVARNLAEVDAKIARDAGAQGQGIRIAVTEWGPNFSIALDSPYLDHVKTLGSALYVASVMKAFIESPRTDYAHFFKLSDPLWMGWIGKRGDELVATAPYLALQLYARYFGDRLVHSEVQSATFDSATTGWVQAVRGVPYLEAVASTSGGGDRLHLLVINKHFDDAIDAEVSVRGFRPARTIEVHQLTGTGIDAHTGSTLPKAPGVKWAEQRSDSVNPRFARGGPGEVRTTHSQATVGAESFVFSFPAHSVTVLEMVRAR
ncbi:MAG: hypothetical protein H6983_26095 [Ectothiorhodospiraceae bacterium]|nr:hypothetical protein [Ectothiorhodospiraceae bacterium]